MSYHRGYVADDFERHNSAAYQHLGAKTSSQLERAKSKERQKEKVNKKQRRSDGPRRSNDQFVPNDQYKSNPRKHCISVAKNPTNVPQTPSLAFAENSALTSAKVCTKSNFKMESWKKPDDLEKAREVHRRKFQATLDSLVEEFESGALATRIQSIKTVRMRFGVHYVTHSPRQILAVTGSHDNLGKWKSFVQLKRAEEGFWFCTVVFPVSIQVEWKFILVEDGEIVRWEECGNRRLEIPRNMEDEEIRVYCEWGYH